MEIWEMWLWPCIGCAVAGFLIVSLVSDWLNRETISIDDAHCTVIEGDWFCHTNMGMPVAYAAYPYRPYVVVTDDDGGIVRCWNVQDDIGRWQQTVEVTRRWKKSRLILHFIDKKLIDYECAGKRIDIFPDEFRFTAENLVVELISEAHL